MGVLEVDVPGVVNAMVGNVQRHFEAMRDYGCSTPTFFCPVYMSHIFCGQMRCARRCRANDQI